MPWLRAASDSSSMVMPLAGSVMAPLLWLSVLQVEAAQKLGVEGDDDGGQAHQDGTDGRGQDDPGPGQGAGRDRRTGPGTAPRGRRAPVLVVVLHQNSDLQVNWGS